MNDHRTVLKQLGWSDELIDRMTAAGHTVPETDGGSTSGPMYEDNVTIAISDEAIARDSISLVLRD
jgi:hypothetical protein